MAWVCFIGDGAVLTVCVSSLRSGKAGSVELYQGRGTPSAHVAQ